MGYGKDNYSIGTWSLQKLELLEKYLPAYQKACTKAHDCIYIDAFAGRGTWRLKDTEQWVDGSPKIALRYLGGFTAVHFVEFDLERVEELRRLREQCSAPQKVHIHHGDANEVLPRILKDINKNAPTFVFLDPSRDQLHWSTIETLSQWRTELYLLYPLHMAILRMMARDHISPKMAERLDIFFGCTDWRKLWEENTAAFRRRLPDKLLSFYESRLRSLGYNHLETSECFRGKEKQRLYYMIWTSRHDVGAKIMTNVRKALSGDYVQMRLDLGL